MHKVVQSGGASVVAKRLGGQLVECGYRGVVTRSNLLECQRAMLRAMGDAPSAVIRTDGCAFLIDVPVIDKNAYRLATCPAAVVVTQLQYDLFQTWCERLASEAGIVRAVFLNLHLEAARRWAEDHSFAAPSRSQPLPLSQLQPGPVGLSACQTIVRSTAPLG